MNLKKVRAETKAFYHEVEKQYIKKAAKGNPDTIADLNTIKRIIYNEFDELMISPSDIETGKQIGKGATSEVFIGQYRFCPVAVKKVKLA